MNINHVISSIDNSSGGPTSLVINLLSDLGEAYPGMIQYLHTARTNNPMTEDLSEENLELNFYKRDILGRLIGFTKLVDKNPQDIFHGHGIWQMPVHQMAKFARTNNIPYVISPHGMLKPWSLNQSRFKKNLALKLYQQRDLEYATCLHTTAAIEAEALRALGYKNPIATIPNGIPLMEFPEKKPKAKTAKRKLLFLSRIVENKGVKELILAWEKLAPSLKKDWEISIIGNGEKDYLNYLNRMIEVKGLNTQISILDPLYGKEKIKAFQDASLFVLPTYSENFGIVVAEALACGTPVITTKEAPWQDLLSHNCGWWIDTGIRPLTKALEQALAMPEDILQPMGKRGRSLIEKKYSMEAVAKQMFLLYKWIYKGGELPEFVNTEV